MSRLTLSISIGIPLKRIPYIFTAWAKNELLFVRIDQKLNIPDRRQLFDTGGIDINSVSIKGDRGLVYMCEKFTSHDLITAVAEILVNRKIVRHKLFVIEHIPEVIKSVEMTANMESQLTAVENGEETPEAVIDSAIKLVHEVMEIEKSKPHENLGTQTREIIGKCPKCGANVYEGNKGWYCENYKAEKPCSFSLWKNDSFFASRKKKLTVDILKNLLANGKVLLKGCYSERTGKTYDAYVGFIDYIGKDKKLKTGFTILGLKNNNRNGGKK